MRGPESSPPPGSIPEGGETVVNPERDALLERARGLYLSGYIDPSYTLLKRYGAAGDLAQQAIESGVSAARDGTYDRSFLSLFGSEAYGAMEEEPRSELLRDCLGILQGKILECATEQGDFFADKEVRQTLSLLLEAAEGNNFATDFWGVIAYSPLRPAEVASVFRTDESLYSSEIRSRTPFDYPFEPLVLDLLEELPKHPAGERESTELLVDFWLKSRNPAYSNGVTAALSGMETEHAARLLLQALRNEKENRRSISAVLYRLELGRIGVSPEGVRYFGTLYDLGAMNSPRKSARRVTDRGDIGVFDENDRLEGYFRIDEQFQGSDPPPKS